MKRPLPCLLAFLLLAALPPAGACAKWAEGDAGAAYSSALSLPAGNAPTAAGAGDDVTVSWAVAEGGAPVAGYQVERYDLSGQPQPVGPGCAGTLPAASCTESGVPAGQWRYTVTPVSATWRGAESAESVPVTVEAPAQKTISTFAWALGDASSGRERDESEPLAFAGDGLSAKSERLSDTFEPGRYLQFDLSSSLAPGSPASAVAFDFDFAPVGGHDTACFYFQVRRASTDTVVATHGSPAEPVACQTGDEFLVTETPLPEVGSAEAADDLRVRVFVDSERERPVEVDLATVSGGAPGLPFTLYDAELVDASGGSAPVTTPWALYEAEDGAVYTSYTRWRRSFSEDRYLRLGFPGYVPAGATVTEASLALSFGARGDRRELCIYVETFAGSTPIGTHGSAAEPLACSPADEFATETIALPEATEAAVADDLVVRVYCSSDHSAKGELDLARLDVSYAD
jgi:hypothetical protein